MTRAEAVQFLAPKWKIVTEVVKDHVHELTLDTGQLVEVYSSGAFHVSGKGWKQINRHLQEAQWPRAAALRTESIRNSLAQLPLVEKKYFNEGLSCIQFAQAPRAAIVLGWTGFMDVLHNRLARDLVALNQAFAKKFPKLHSKGELKGLNDIPELEDWQTLNLGHEMKLYEKHAHTQLDAMRDLRNNCAHVEEFAVTFDMALGFYGSLAEYLKFVL
jgi:hypothetical protein